MKSSICLGDRSMQLSARLTVIPAKAGISFPSKGRREAALFF
jgi:hypothetical protein